jgi:hypothetical protein
VPFQQRQPELALHLGRPLEPQQQHNLRMGLPAGPMKDTEFPRHPPTSRPPPPAKPEPPRRMPSR